MTAFISPIFGAGTQLLNNSGGLLVGGQIFTYAAGGTVPTSTWTTSSQSVTNANPIILDSSGRVVNEIWLQSGVSYKFIVQDSLGNQIGSTWDNISGVNDVSISQSEWTASGLTPSYISSTQFSTVGNNVVLFNVNRRVQASVTSGTIYGYISASSFSGGFTTVTVVWDSTQLDNGLTSVNVAVLNGQNQSVPFNISKAVLADSATNLLNTASTKLPTITATVAANALTIGMSSVYLDFRSATIGSGTISTILSAPANLVVPSTATLGTVNAVQSRLVVLAINNAGTIELAVVNIAGGNDLSETGVINSTTIAGASNTANVIYSTTGRTGVAYRVVGYVESTQATAGTWATAPSTIQGAGGNALTAMSSLGYGQTWQSVTRTSGVTYYNTGKPIKLKLVGNSGTNNNLTMTVGSLSFQTNISSTSQTLELVNTEIPAGMSYSYTQTTGTVAAYELR